MANVPTQTWQLPTSMANDNYNCYFDSKLRYSISFTYRLLRCNIQIDGLHASRCLFPQDGSLFAFFNGYIETSIDMETQIVQFLGQIPSNGCFTASNQDTFAGGSNLEREWGKGGLFMIFFFVCIGLGAKGDSWTVLLDLSYSLEGAHQFRMGSGS